MNTIKNKSFFSVLKQNGPWGEFEPKSKQPRKTKGNQDFDDIENRLEKALLMRNIFIVSAAVFFLLFIIFAGCYGKSQNKITDLEEEVDGY